MSGLFHVEFLLPTQPQTVQVVVYETNYMWILLKD